jgi:phosphoglycolate phosphatase
MLRWYRRHHARALVRKSRLLPNAALILRMLARRGCLLAVASNRPTRFARILIRHLRIARYFNTVLCADQLSKGKPHPLILRSIMRTCKVPPRYTVYIGDMQLDALTAHRAGVRSVLVASGSHTRAELARCRPWKLCASVAELALVLVPLTVG